mmetsp:Transcript_104994/g.296679  ORF Transcript_104994/g.296679 Transcript_104994/m.296679 type:complete len:271 (-) Transcript_104994:320-1132(-)
MLAVGQLEAGSQQVRCFAGHGVGLVLAIQPADELLPPLLDAVVHVGLAQLLARLVLILGLARVLRLCVALAEPGVLHHLPGVEPLLLALFEAAPDQVLAGRVHALGDPDLFGPDVALVLEGEAPADQAVHDDAHGPNVNFKSIILVKKFGRPEDLRPNGSGKTVAWLDAHGRAEVREHDAALRVSDVPARHQVVVPLDVAVDNALVVQEIDAGPHLAHHRHDVVAGYLPSVLQVHLQALDEVAAAVLVHDDADEAPLVEDAVDLDDVRVG